VKDTTYTVEFSEEQLQTIIEACDLYSRLQLGQLHMLTEPYGVFPVKSISEHQEQVKYLTDALKAYLYPELSKNAYYGIFSDSTPEPAKELWDIQQVLRHSIAWHNYPEGGMTVNFDTPLPASKLPLCKVTNIKEATNDTSQTKT